jgi:hypothetical protein
VVEGKSDGRNKNKKGDGQKTRVAPLTRKVMEGNRKGKKGEGQKNENVAIVDVGNSRYVSKILLACQSIDWWLDTRANVHVCSDLNLFSSYQVTDSSNILMGNGSRVDVHGIGIVDLKLISRKTLFKECATCSKNK